MKQVIVLTVVFLCSISSILAQEEYFQPAQKDLDYREYRMKRTIPPYGLDKVNKLIKTIVEKSFEDSEGGIAALRTEQFQSLSLREKFTYVMVHPETYSQNCAIFIPLPDEDKKVFSHLMSWVDESTWSDRQINYLLENRDSVMSLIQESTLRSKHMGVNYKDAIIKINGWEMIPFLIQYYQSNKKDKDILTLLLLLMKKGEFVEFLKSSSYKKLYGSDYNYESYIDFNTANEKLIIERATKYYEGKSQ